MIQKKCVQEQLSELLQANELHTKYQSGYSHQQELWNSHPSFLQ